MNLKEMRTLGRRTRKLRQDQNLTIKQLSNKTGLSSSTLRRLETADTTGYNPHLDTLAYLAYGLDVKVAELTNRPVVMTDTQALKQLQLL